MIDGSADLRIGVLAERLCHKTADKKMMRLSAIGKAHSIVSFVVHERRQEPRCRAFQGFDASI